MKISLIVPYRDAEPWLPRCIASLQRQVGPFEFLLINDGSEDAGPILAEDITWIDGRFRSYDNEHAPGVSGARNTGIERAQGEWVTFLDADDTLQPDAFLTYRAAIREDRSANVIQLNHYRYYTAIDKLAFKYTNAGGEYNLQRLPVIWIGVWNKLFRRSFIEDVRFREGLQYGEDGLFVLECLAKENRLHHAKKSAAAVVHRFETPDSLSHRKTPADLLQQVREYEDFLMKQEDPATIATMCDLIKELWEPKKWMNK